MGGRMRRGWVVVGAILAATSDRARADPAPAGAPTPLQLAAMPAVKIVVRATGWTRVKQADLVAAGLDPGVDPARLRLYADGFEQAIAVTGNGDATFDRDEALEFYGVARDTLWTDAHTYWLVVGAGGTAGKRVPLVASPPGNVAPGSLPFTATMRDRKVYYAPLKNGDDSNFFAAFVDAGGVTETIGLHHLAAADTATLRIVLQGVTVGGHVVAVSLNGQALGSCRFEGQTLATCALAPPAVLEGDNQITLVAPGSAPDYSLLAAIEVDYAHALAVEGDRLALTAPPAARLVLRGFSSPAVRIFDVTDPTAVVELTTGTGFDGSSFFAIVNTPGATSSRTLWAVADAIVPGPASVAANHPSAWTDPLAGELVILSHAQFLDAVRPLADRRAEEGWTVQLVDLQDAYDEFGGGDKTPFAIRDFLAAARARWRVPPRFVLLVGDASVDPRNFLGLGDFDLAPTKLIDTASMETASDDWFVDDDQDGVPEAAMGRISVRTSAEATTVVQKILGYAGAADLSQGGLFVTDPSEDGLDFQGASAAGAAAVAGLMPVDTLLIDGTSATSSALLTKLGQGPFLVDYTGHGSVTVWDGVFSGNDAAALGNQRLSIYVAMNCLNGLFQDLYTESLAESLLKAPNGGAVAVWASSTLNSFDPQTVMNRELLARLTRTSLGEAVIAAKRAITDGDARRTWILFGDPTLFGRPATSAGSDGGATDDAGTPTDAGVGPSPSPSDDGGASDGGRLEGGADRASPIVDGGPSHEASADARPGEAPPGGCGCNFEPPGTGGGVGLGLLLLVAACRRLGRRRGARASGRAQAQASRLDR
jgi:Peptidase family C25